VFMFPQRGGEIAQREQQPAHMTFSKISAMGSDGQMHTETHKVFTETSSDGLQKRTTEVDCKDGDCSKSVSFFGHLPGLFSSMAPTNIFKGMPRAGESMPEMQTTMGGGMQMEMPEKMKWLMHRMHHCHHMMHHMMNRFRGGVDDQKMPQMPVQHMSLHFLAPTANVVQMQAPPFEAEEPAVVDAAPEVPVEFQVIAGVGFVSFVVMFIALARMCLFGKAQARERPLEALGQPLAPEAQAELGLAQGVVVPPQSLADFVKIPATPTQSYLLNLYARAGKPTSEAELATVVLRDVYSAALARVPTA